MTTGRRGKLSDAAIAEIKAWNEVRKSIPTATEIIKRHSISKQMLWLICHGFIYKVSRG